MIQPAPNGLFVPECCGFLRVKMQRVPTVTVGTLCIFECCVLLNDKPETYIKHRLVVVAYAC